MSINYGKCPVCENPLEQTHFCSINGICCERELKCNFCLSYEHTFNYGNIKETIAWCEWCRVDIMRVSMDNYLKMITIRKRQQREFTNTFRQYFEKWRQFKDYPSVFADYLQEEMFQGETNDMLDELRTSGMIQLGGSKNNKFPKYPKVTNERTSTLS